MTTESAAALRRRRSAWVIEVSPLCGGGPGRDIRASHLLRCSRHPRDALQGMSHGQSANLNESTTGAARSITSLKLASVA